MKLYLIRYIDYYNDNSCEHVIEANSKQEAIEEFKRSKIKYWRLVEIDEIH